MDCPGLQLTLLDLFTNAPFAVVRSDLYSKITKVRARLDTREETLEGLLEDEKARGYKGPDAVTGAMTWLLRYARMGSTLHSPPQEPAVHVDGAASEHDERGGGGIDEHDLGVWRDTQAVPRVGGEADLPGELRLSLPKRPTLLSTPHLSSPPPLPFSPRGQRQRQLAMKAVPYRANFYRVLGEPTEVVMVELDAWLDGLERILRRMEGVYKEGKYGSIDGRP